MVRIKLIANEQPFRYDINVAVVWDGLCFEARLML